jgi:hypothetical protein
MVLKGKATLPFMGIENSVVWYISAGTAICKVELPAREDEIYMYFGEKFKSLQYSLGATALIDTFEGVPKDEIA